MGDATKKNCLAEPHAIGIEKLLRQIEIAKEQPRPQLGDRLESLLKKVGITQEKYKHLKEMAGLDPHCNCEPRRRFLNKLPAALALGYARGGICGAYQSALQLARENKEYFSKPR
jgi:hypothetical protein